MTQPIKRRVQRRSVVNMTMAGALASAILVSSAAAQQISWPSTRWRDDPAGFARDILKVAPWAKQAEVLAALVPKRARVAVAAGHKIGKSNLAVDAALWFYSSFEDARVVMSSTTDRQVNQILWRELRKSLVRAGRCDECRAKDQFSLGRCTKCQNNRPIPEEPYEQARSGLKSSDFREIVGFTAREAEGIAGISGANILYILDEASGIPDEIFEAIEGNRAGGARVLMLGNPTRNEGWFYRAFHDKREFWKTFQVSSAESPNVIAGEELIPGLACREWVEEMRVEWGADSAIYMIRVDGQFAKQEDSKVISVHLVTESEERWHDEDIDISGRLHVGVDVARFGDDDSAIAPRRSQKIFEVVSKHGRSESELADDVIQVVRKYRRPGEQKALIKVDACGGIGIRVCAELNKYSDEIDIVPVNVAERATLPREYPLLRDQLWFAGRSWLKEGGALPTDPKLEAELTCPVYTFDERGRRRVEGKDAIRKRIKRSPDRADAIWLSVWEPSMFSQSDEVDAAPAIGIDPYVGAELAINPYGHMPDPYG